MFMSFITFSKPSISASPDLTELGEALLGSAEPLTALGETEGNSTLLMVSGDDNSVPSSSKDNEELNFRSSTINDVLSADLDLVVAIFRQEIRYQIKKNL